MSPSRLAAAALTLLVLAGCPTEIVVPDNPPEARVDYKNTPLNTPVTFTPLLNDFDPTGEAITVVSITQPSHGTAVLNGSGTVDYTPNSGYLGPDQFTVTIRDASGWEASNEAYITVGPAQRIAFRSNFNDYFTFQLYMVDLQHPLGMIPISHRIPITKGPAISHQQVTGFADSSDGVNMLFLADDNDTRSVVNLFHADLRTPGISTRLTDIQSGQAISLFSSPQLAPDGLHVYYLSNEFQPELMEIVQVEVANPANKVRINTPISFGVANDSSDDDFIERFSLAPDNQHLLYVARDADGGNGGTTALSELRVVDLANPGVSTVISGTPTPGELGVVGSSGALGFRFVPGTSKVVYSSRENGALKNDLYIVDYLTPSTPVKLTGTCLGSCVASFGFTPDGTRIVYISNEDVDTVADLYTVQLAAPGVSTRLSKLRTGPDVTMGSFDIGQDSTFVLYLRDDDTTDVRELYFVDFANPTVQVKLNHALRPAGTNTTTDPAEVVFSSRLNRSAPRKVIYVTNEIPVSGVVHQTLRLVDVDSPGTQTIVGKQTFINHAFGWMDDADTLIYQDSAPENIAATTLNMTKISTPGVYTRLTPEDNGGDVATIPAFLP